MEMKIEIKKKPGVSFYTMADKICIIRQPAGLGDILFSQKIVSKIKEKYNLEILWPISDHYSSLKEDIVSSAKFCSINDDFPFKSLFHNRNIIDNNEVLYIPLQDADQYYPGLCMMDSKYKFVGLNYNDWQMYINLKRNYDKENKLKEILKIKKDEKYVVLNRNYGSLSAPATCSYLKQFSSKHKIIEVNPIEGFSLFNWCTIFENALEIHSVDTSIMYIIEKLNVAAKLFCYSRYIPPSFHDVTHLFKKNWTYVKDCI